MNCEPGLSGIGRPKVVGDHTLVLPLTGEVHVTQLQRSCVLRHLRLTSCTSLHPQMGLIVDLCIIQDLVVFLPGKSHGRVAGARSRAHERHVGAFEGRLCLWLHCDLRLREVICVI